MSVVDDLNKSKSTVRVNVWDYPSVTCEKCGGEIFVPAVIFKKISGLMLGVGAEDVTQPVPVYICQKCGDLMPEYKEDIKAAQRTPKNTSSLII